MRRGLSSLAVAAALASLQAGPALAQPSPRPSLPPPGLGAPPVARLPSAEAVAESMRFCAAKPEPERLGCYDQVAVALGGRPAVERSVRQYAWTVDAPETSGGHPSRATLSLGASEVSAADDLFSRPEANLVLRCRPGEVHVWVAFPTAVARAPVPTAVRFDGHSVAGSTWDNSESGAAVGLWRSQEASVGLARRLREVRRLSLSFALPGGRVVSATFDVDQYSGVPEGAREACGLT